MKKKTSPQIGRLGPAENIRPAGAMGDRRTKRRRTRAAQRRAAIADAD